MEILLKTEFFLQIQNNNKTNIKHAYRNFMKDLFTFCKSAEDTIHACLILNYTCMEFVFLQNSIAGYKSKKK